MGFSSHVSVKDVADMHATKRNKNESNIESNGRPLTIETPCSKITWLGHKPRLRTPDVGVYRYYDALNLRQTDFNGSLHAEYCLHKETALQ